jgi:hypothetical protein
MNERIKELAEQCYHRYSEHHIDLEKFAELIVRECAEFAEQKYGNWYRTNAPGDSPSIAIKQHFGVE